MVFATAIRQTGIISTWPGRMIYILTSTAMTIYDGVPGQANMSRPAITTSMRGKAVEARPEVRAMVVSRGLSSSAISRTEGVVAVAKAAARWVATRAHSMGSWREGRGWPKEALSTTSFIIGTFPSRSGGGGSGGKSSKFEIVLRLVCRPYVFKPPAVVGSRDPRDVDHQANTSADSARSVGNSRKLKPTQGARIQLALNAAVAIIAVISPIRARRGDVEAGLRRPVCEHGEPPATPANMTLLRCPMSEHERQVDHLLQMFEAGATTASSVEVVGLSLGGWSG